MKKDIEKIHADVRKLKMDLSNANQIISYHKHKNYDQTSPLDPNYSRIGLVDQATITSDATAGQHFFVTLKGNRTLGNPTGAAPGQRILFELIQDATGSRTITLGSKFSAGAFTITLTTTASKRDFLEVVYSDTDDKFYVINFVKGY